MSEQYPGGFISKTEPTVNGSVARGMWTLSQAAGYAKQGLWPTVPAAPTIGTATGGDTTASVAFTAPSNIGSSAITSYTATSSPGGFTGTGVSSPITVSGLTNGTAYTFTVTATNGAGTGPASSASNSVTPAQINYIEDVYSTYLYKGNNSAQTITNGIDLAGKGGLVWGKSRSASQNHRLYDTARGSNYSLISNDTAAQSNQGTNACAFNADGFSLSAASGIVGGAGFGGPDYASWTFRKQPKFFDVVTYTGNSVIGRAIPHSLGSAPGCVIVKSTDAAGENWAVWHRSGTQNGYFSALLNSTSAYASQGGAYWQNNGVAPDMNSATFSVGNNGATNQTGNSYVAYLFAHDAGGFGLTGTDNVISCGSFTDTSTGGVVDLGYEPQFVLVKSVDVAGSWFMLDTMRGWINDSASGSSGQDKYLFANSSGAEGNYQMGEPTATGFRFKDNASGTYIYIAIRRGPMKVPTSGTSVFKPTKTSAADGTAITVGFPTDSQWANYLAGDGNNTTVFDRLRGMSSTSGSTSQNRTLFTSTTGAESSSFGVNYFTGVNNTGWVQGSYASGVDTVRYDFRRAPSFFDEVCYTGTGSATTFAHNLGAVPELMIVKERSSPAGWWWNVYYGTANKFLKLNTTDAETTSTAVWNNTAPTSSVFSVGAYNPSNTSGSTYVAYLFASCAGVSKVGSYTGTGATQTIACGFAAGARFVLIKRTDSTGDWYLWDSARGMVAGTDPSLLLNSTAAQVNANSVYAITTGFQIVSTAAGINASGGTYIFLAIA